MWVINVRTEEDENYKYALKEQKVLFRSTKTSLQY